MELPEFKLIVAGGRTFNDYQRMETKLIELAENEYKNHAISIVSGMARGADALAVRFAHEYNVQLYSFPADWDGLGMSAGYERNKQMAQFADGLLAFWDKRSRGTRHMIRLAEHYGIDVHVEFY